MSEEIFQDDDMRLLEMEANQEEQEKQDQLNQLDQDLKNDTDEYDSGQDEAKKREYVPDQEMIGLLNIPVQFGANYFMPNWEIEDEEVLSVSACLDRFIDKYFPSARIPDSPEAALLLTVASIAAPRVGKGIPMKKLEKKEGEKENQDQLIDELGVLSQDGHVNGEAV